MYACLRVSSGGPWRSVASSVSIVIVNKYLISTLGYRYVTFLTALHQLVTAGALRGAARAGLLEPKTVERGALLRFSVLNGGAQANHNRNSLTENPLFHLVSPGELSTKYVKLTR